MSGIRKRTRHHYRRYGKRFGYHKKCKDQRRTDISLPQPDHLVLFMRPSRNPCDGGNEPRIPWLMAKMGAFEPSYNVPGAVPQWQAAVLDRAKTNFETLKNHPSILFWSLGNESYAEENIRQMNDYFKK